MDVLQICYSQPVLDNEQERCQNGSNKYCDPKDRPQEVYIEDGNYWYRFFYSNVDYRTNGEQEEHLLTNERGGA